MIGVAAEMAGISLVGLEKSGRLGTRSGPSESSPVWRPRTIGRLQKFRMPNTAHSLHTSRGVTDGLSGIGTNVQQEPQNRPEGLETNKWEFLTPLITCWLPVIRTCDLYCSEVGQGLD